MTTGVEIAVGASVIGGSLALAQAIPNLSGDVASVTLPGILAVLVLREVRAILKDRQRSEQGISCRAFDSHASDMSDGLRAIASTLTTIDKNQAIQSEVLASLGRSVERLEAKLH